MWQTALITGTPSDAGTMSFEEVLNQRQVQLLRIAYRMLGNWADAEDVAQEAFVRLHRHGLGFPGEAQLAAWLCRVTVNLCLDRLRSRRPSADLPELPSTEGSVESELLREERKSMLEAALQELPLREKTAIVLREIEGLSTAEVAAIMGSTEVTVRSQVSKALGRLRGVLMRDQR
jgi:RNA polymerase sigma-70 factor (ECF subfamily)